jgi:hypothetical protein
MYEMAAAAEREREREINKREKIAKKKLETK